MGFGVVDINKNGQPSEQELSISKCEFVAATKTGVVQRQVRASRSKCWTLTKTASSVAPGKIQTRCYLTPTQTASSRGKSSGLHHLPRSPCSTWTATMNSHAQAPTAMARSPRANFDRDGNGKIAKSNVHGGEIWALCLRCLTLNAMVASRRA